METYDPTIEDSYRKQVVIDNQLAVLEVLDTAGQEEYTALRDQWIRDGEGFILVYSITSRSSFSRVKNYFSQIQRVKEEDEAYALVLVGNKSDRSNERQISRQEGEALARELGNVPFFESSAKLNINTENAFFACARKCRQLRDPKTVPNQPNNNYNQHATNNIQSPNNIHHRPQPQYSMNLRPNNDVYNNEPKKRKNKGKCSIM